MKITDPGGARLVRYRRRYCREIAVASIPLAVLIGILLHARIPQDPRYHLLADVRSLLGVPNLLNVATNIPFPVLGMLGLAQLRVRPAGATTAWAVFFGAVVLVGFGSGWYHAAPSDATLVWDRLPMTVAFMGLLVALFAEHIHPALERHLLVPAIVLGLASVGWWRYADDLRLYVWVQGAPLLAVSLVLLLFPPRYTGRVYLLYGLGFYLLAKVAEYYDTEVFRLTGDTVSGHSIKHLLASAAVLCICLMLRRRRAIAA